MTFNTNADRDMAIMNVAHALTSDLRKCLLHHEMVSFAVPGGTTPGPVFDVMRSVDIDWARVQVMLTDERWVPEDHARSNAGLVKARLLQDRAAAAAFVSFYRDGLSAQDAAPQVAQTLAQVMPISVLLLGMGADMHTASLFPGAPGVAAAMARDAPLLCAVHPADQPEARITLSASALDGAMHKHLVIFGDDKRAAFEAAKGLPPGEAPISAVLSGGTTHWAA